VGGWCARESLIAIWANHAYEADYRPCFRADHREPLTDERRYRLHFDAPPPAFACWSVTLYDEPGHFLVDNPINRYALDTRRPDK
jgi:hypothetical protein